MRSENQSHHGALVEAVINTASGFILAMLAQSFIINPVWDLELEPHDNLGIVLVFTVISVVRSYVWRRIFNRRTPC